MRKINIKPGTPVRVNWVDATSPQAGWDTPREKYELGRANSLGFVITHDKESLTIAPHVIETSENQSIGDPMILPWGMITDIQEVRSRKLK